MPPSLCVNLSADEQAQLLEIARRSIQTGLETDRALQLEISQLSENLGIKSAVFITLTRFGELRGCIGSLHAVDPLAKAVANSAFNAAFRDHRFDPLPATEINEARIEISVLSEMKPIQVDSRQALLDDLQPGVDGLLIEDRGHRSTFLPKVWEKISSPNEFLEHLLQKAGLPPGHWSSTIQCHRYNTVSFSEN